MKKFKFIWSSDEDIFSNCSQETSLNRNKNSQSSSDSEKYLASSQKKNAAKLIKNKKNNSLNDFIVPDDELSHEDDQSFYLSVTRKLQRFSIFSSKSSVSSDESELASHQISSESDNTLDSWLNSSSDSPIRIKRNNNDNKQFKKNRQTVNKSEFSSDSWLDTSSESIEEAESVYKSNKKSRALSNITNPKISNNVIDQQLTLIESLHIFHHPNHPYYSYLHPDAKHYVTTYRKNYRELTMKLYENFNQYVFDNNLPKDPQIVWNPRLLKTAGQCIYKRMKQVANQSDEVIYERLITIHLSPKVLTTADRLRDTLLHEACHGYVWLVYGVNAGHGPLWKAIARKAMIVYPNLPRVTRCHAYAIETKYSYICTTEGCGIRINRHSKSIDINKKVCGRCKGKFTLIYNKNKKKELNSRSRVAETSSIPAPLTPFAKFVKNNYKTVRQDSAHVRLQSTPAKVVHAETMKTLSEMFKKLKTNDNENVPPIIKS